MAPPWPIEHRTSIETDPHQSPARAFFYLIAVWSTLIRAQVALELFPSVLGGLSGRQRAEVARPPSRESPIRPIGIRHDYRMELPAHRRGIVGIWG